MNLVFLATYAGTALVAFLACRGEGSEWTYGGGDKIVISILPLLSIPFIAVPLPIEESGFNLLLAFGTGLILGMALASYVDARNRSSVVFLIVGITPFASLLLHLVKKHRDY